jgi:hypothetical protein
MAERMGFEPMIEFPLYTLSKRAPSTTRPPLLVKFLTYHKLYEKFSKLTILLSVTQKISNLFILSLKKFYFSFFIFSTPINASWGISTRPNCFDRAFPFFCFSKSFLFLSVAPPP